MSREILALKREDDGSFGIYIDGELDEIYRLDDEHPEVAQGVLPIKLWRAFNKALERRAKSLESSPHYHHWEDGTFYNHSHRGGVIPHGHHGSRYGMRDLSISTVSTGEGRMP